MSTPSFPSPLAIIVHGGAGNIPTTHYDRAENGCLAAAQVGWQALTTGATALDAVEAVVRAQEDNPTFNAGRGSVLNRAGEVEMDAGIMDGAALSIGAVALVRHFAHPISLARAVMVHTDHHVLAGAGAETFAREHGFSEIANEALITERRRKQYAERLSQQVGVKDTVGALALDAAGNVAAANSTGGVPFKLAGRVGDSPIPGAGFFADNRYGAVATTGQGEHIMQAGLAFLAMAALEQGATAQEAAAHAAQELLRRVPEGRAGLIVLDATGRVGVAHTTRNISFAYRTAEMESWTSGVRWESGIHQR